MKLYVNLQSKREKEEKSDNKILLATFKLLLQCSVVRVYRSTAPWIVALVLDMAPSFSVHRSLVVACKTCNIAAPQATCQASPV